MAVAMGFEILKAEPPEVGLVVELGALEIVERHAIDHDLGAFLLDDEVVVRPVPASHHALGKAGTAAAFTLMEQYPARLRRKNLADAARGRVGHRKNPASVTGASAGAVVGARGGFHGIDFTG